MLAKLKVIVSIEKALSDLFKSITSLPTDITLISLPAGPLLEIVCFAAQRQLSAVWLSLASILIAQLNPPVFSLNMKSGPTPEAFQVVQRLLPVLMQCGLSALSVEGYMEAVSLLFNLTAVSRIGFFLSFWRVESGYCTRVLLVYGEGMFVCLSLEVVFLFIWR